MATKRPASGGYFDAEGHPIAAKWDGVEVPGVTDQNAYALEITGDSMLPVYREGDLIIVSPNAVRCEGDRVVVKTKGGNIFARVLISQDAGIVCLAPFDPTKPEEQFQRADIEWMARIVWATQ